MRKVRQGEVRDDVVRVENDGQLHPTLQLRTHDSIHLVVRDMTSLPKVYGVNGVIIYGLPILVKSLNDPCMPY